MIRKYIISLLLITSVLLALAGTPVSAANNEDFEEFTFEKDSSQFAQDRIIVKFKDGVSNSSINTINQRFDTSTSFTSLRDNTRLINVPEGYTAREMVDLYSGLPDVEYAELDTVCYALWEPNDPYYSSQWHLDNDSYGGINVEAAWELNHTSPGEGVVVAVIDTGVAYENYTEYSYRYYYNYGLAPDLADTTFVSGWDFVNGDAHPNDDHGHGTHVAGTIAQSTNNGIGTAGIAFKASIMPIKVLNSSGGGYASWLAEGITYAADHGADIISMSLGFEVEDSVATYPGTAVRNAIEYAYEQGVTIIAASGNDYENAVAYPAAFDDWVIAVGGTDQSENVYNFSNTGSSLDITAPGRALQQTFSTSYSYDRRTRSYSYSQNFGYYWMSGTSMATPHVSGVAALVIANGVTGPDNVRQALEQTAEDHGSSGWDSQYGWGIVDAYAALQYTAGDPPVAEANGPYSGDEGDTITFSSSGSNDPDGSIVTYSWNFGDGETGSGASPTHAYGDNGTYTVTLTVTDDDGLTDSDTATATIDNVAPEITGTANRSGNEGSAISFTAGTVTDPGDDDTFEYRWNFEGTYTGWSSSNTASHTWNDDYNGTVVVEVKDDDGDTDTDSCTVTVNNVAPTANAGGPYNGTVNIAVTLTGSATDPGADTFTYAWDLDNDTYYDDATGQSTSSTWTSTGTYTIGLQVTDDNGGVDTDSTTVTIYAANQPPTADAGGPYSSDEGDAISFDGSGSSDTDGTINSYAWDFGDGETGTGVSPIHTYDDDGTYTVTLTVTDDDSATDSDTATVTVDNVAPTADAGGPYSGTSGESITLTGSASDPGDDTLTYNWDLDNDSSYDDATGQSVTYSWGSEGTYTVGLQVTDGDGGEDTDTATVTISDVSLEPEEFSFSGSFRRSGGEEAYTVSVSSPGASSMSVLLSGRGYGDLVLRIYNPSGALVAEVDVDGSTYNDTEEAIIYDLEPGNWRVAAYALRAYRLYYTIEGEIIY